MVERRKWQHTPISLNHKTHKKKKVNFSYYSTMPRAETKILKRRKKETERERERESYAINHT